MYNERLWIPTKLVKLTKMTMFETLAQNELTEPFELKQGGGVTSSL